MDNNTLYGNLMGVGDTSAVDSFLARDTNAGGEQISSLGRLAYGAATAIPRAASGILDSSERLAGLFGAGPTGPENPLLTLPEGQNAAQKFSSFVGEGLLPLGLELAATGAVGRGIGAVAGLEKAGMAQRVLNDALGFGFTALPSGNDVAAEQAGEGALYGALGYLPRVKRLLPAAALAFGSKLFFDQKNPNPVVGNFTQGDISGTAGFIVSMLPGQIPIKKAPVAPAAAEAAAHVTAPVAPEVIPHGGVMTDDMVNRFNSAQDPALLAGVPQEHMQAIIDANTPQGPHIPDYVNPESLNTPRYAGGELQGPLLDAPTPEGNAALQNLIAPEGHPLTAQEVSGVFERAPIEAGYTPPEFREGVVPDNSRALAIRPEEAAVGRMFDPANFATIAKSIETPEAPASLAENNIRLQIEMARQSRAEEAMKFFNWAAEQDAKGPGNVLGEHPMQPSLQPEGGTASKVKGKVNPVPESARTEGGITTNPMLMDGTVARAYAQSAGRAAIGGALGKGYGMLTGQSDEESNTSAAYAAALGAFGPGLLMHGSEAMQRALGVSRDLHGIANPFKDGHMPEGISVKDVPTQEGHTIEFYQNGELKGTINAEKKAGKLQIVNSDIDPALRGQKLALYAYDRLADVAKENNLQLVSDRSVSSDAARVYDAMQRRGYDVQKSKESYSYNDPTGKQHTLSYREPVYTVNPPSEGNLAAVAKPEGNLPPSEPTTMKLGGKKASEMGAVLPELQNALARGIVGGGLGGAVGGSMDDPDSHTKLFWGGLTGALAAMGGPAIGKALAEAMAVAKAAPELKAKGFDRVIEEKAGSVISRGSEKVTDRFTYWMDKMFNVTMPKEVIRALNSAKGEGSALLDALDASMMKLSARFKPDEALQKAANEYLNTSDFEKLKADLGPRMNDQTTQQYVKFLVTGREVVNGLQRMVEAGVGDVSKQKMINASIGKYLTRTYKMFTNPNWRPTEATIQKLVDEVHGQNVWEGATKDDLRRHFEQYIQEVKASKSLYPTAKFTGAGEKINQAVFQERKDLSEAWKEFLGEIQNPTERIAQTVFRLRPMAEASKYFDILSKMTGEDGLPQTFNSYAEKETFRQKIVNDLKGNVDDATRNKLETQLQQLDNYRDVTHHPKFGELSGKIVNRHVFDTLDTFDSATHVDSPLLRSMANVHTPIKLAQTAFNPLGQIRNMMQMPFFAMVAKAAPQDMATAWEILRNSDHPLRQEIMKQGIGNVDQVKTEFFKEFENLTGSKYNFGSIDLQKLGMGKIDLDIGEKLARRGVRGIMDVYRMPDNIVRIGAYISAKRRFAQALGKAMDDPEVLQKATDFTNRYTMNYDTVAPIVKKARQMPFANLFISYTAEMARIAKNLGEDLIKGGDGLHTHGRMMAAAPLAMLAAVPDMLQSYSESQLSPSDQKDWEAAKKLMPDYARTRYRFVSGRDPKTKQFHYVDFTPMVASDALNQTVKAIATGDTAALKSVNPVAGWDNTPAFNIIAEQVTGKEMRTDREFRGGADRVAAAVREIAPPWFPGAGSEWVRGKAAMTENDKGELGVTNQRNGSLLTPSDYWASYFGPLIGRAVPPGSRVGTASLDILQQKAIKQAKSDIANETAYLNDVMKSDVNNDVKQRANDRFREAVATIREHLSARLGVSQ